MLFRQLGLLVLILELFRQTAFAEPIPASSGQSPTLSLIFAEILENADIDTTLVSAPLERKRRMFARGRIHVDCCTIPEWRQREDESAVQLFSQPFLTSNSSYVFHAMRPIIIARHSDLAEYRVATVRGFKYELASYFGETIPTESWASMLHLVDKGRADLAFVGNIVFHESQTSMRHNLRLGPVVANHALVIRVHKSRKDLLPRINRSIGELIANGTIARLAAVSTIE